MSEKSKLHQGNCLNVLKGFVDNSIDSIVTDPPYGISFMDKKWDYDVPSIEIWRECLRVLKPGGHLLSFSSGRTYHRMAVNIEDAGFEIRDMLEWLYSTGFPKSLNIGKAIDKMKGVEREVVGYKEPFGREGRSYGVNSGKACFVNLRGDDYDEVKQDNLKPVTVPATPEAKQWDGWGSALKPAHEPICLARKPLSEKSIVENVLKWGVGGINIDGCRISHNENTLRKAYPKKGWCVGSPLVGRVDKSATKGRFPANLILECTCDELLEGSANSGGGKNPIPKKSMFGTESETYKPFHYADENGKEKTVIHTDPECPCYMLDLQSGELKSGALKPYKQKGDSIFYTTEVRKVRRDANSGGASRFFYVAKASKRERNLGCEMLEEKYAPNNLSGGSENRLDGRKVGKMQNIHPAVKPIKLMSYLIRLITPKGGTVLDPFMGSGSTGIASHLEGCNFIGVEQDEEYLKIADARIKYWSQFSSYEEVIKIKPIKRKEKKEAMEESSKQLGLFDN